MVAGEKGLIRFEDVYKYAFTGAHCGRLEDEEFDTIVNAIESVPKVDAVEVVHGRWIEKPYLLGTTRYCPICGQNYGMPHGVFNYCPNCGTKMDGGAGNGC